MWAYAFYAFIRTAGLGYVQDVAIAICIISSGWHIQAMAYLATLHVTLSHFVTGCLEITYICPHVYIQ